MTQTHHEPPHLGAVGRLPPGTDRQAFLDRQPTYWLKRCYQALRRHVDGELRQYGLTLSQRDVLLTLYHEGPLDQGALRDRLGLEQSSVSRLVDGLVRRGLVELLPGQDDRRVRIARLTDSGEQLLLQTPGSSELGGRLMVSGLNNEERAELVRLLQRCADNLAHPDPRAQGVPAAIERVSSEDGAATLFEENGRQGTGQVGAPNHRRRNHGETDTEL